MLLRVLFLLLASAVVLHGQIAVGGKKFDRAMAEAGTKGEWVLYEKGAPQNEGTRRFLTKRVLVELQPGTTATKLAGVAGVVKSIPRANGKYAVVEFGGTPDAALGGAERLRTVPGVNKAEPMLARQLFRRFVPNDPLFAYNAANAGYQWHLRNTGQNGATAGMDVNVVPAWDSYKGSGVRIAIVDDGLEVTHPDLSPNIDLANGYDFNGMDEDPTPDADGFHGIGLRRRGGRQG